MRRRTLPIQVVAVLPGATHEHRVAPGDVVAAVVCRFPSRDLLGAHASQNSISSRNSASPGASASAPATCLSGVACSWEYSCAVRRCRLRITATGTSNDVAVNAPSSTAPRCHRARARAPDE